MFNTKGIHLDQYQEAVKLITELDESKFKWASSQILNHVYNGWVKKIVEIYNMIPENERLPGRVEKKK